MRAGSLFTSQAVECCETLHVLVGDGVIVCLDGYTIKIVGLAMYTLADIALRKMKRTRAIGIPTELT